MKTTAKHFKVFVDEFQRLQTLLSLGSWKVYFVHGRPKANVVDAFAWIKTDLSGQVATVHLVDKWDVRRELTDEELKKCARHEVFHLLGARLCELARSRWVTSTEVAEADEELVNRLNSWYGS